MLRLYNTLTRKIEDFIPINPPEVSYYSCGPTVYDYAHIGHARTYVFADILQRVLKFNGYKVKRVMNITDVGHLTSDSDTGEDKMEKGAIREGKSVWDIAKFYTDDFFNMCELLHIRKPEFIPYATKFIPEMIALIKILEDKGFTYQISDGIYYDTSKFPSYGQLMGLTFNKLQKSLKAGIRIDIVKGKKNITDFALWKITPSGVKRQMEWDSPWGKGFPGWHIECSAMSMKYLGETIDIHTGGVDHIPVHHTNEIVQGEAITGKPFVRFWLHGEHLLIEGEKMSKSLGNFHRVVDIEKKGYSPLALRYLFLTASYRKTMNFTWKALEGAQTALESLQAQISNLKSQISNNKRMELSEEKLKKVDDYRNKFTDSINDDLNISSAVSVVWEVVKSNIPPGDKYDLIMLFDEVLGLDFARSKIKDQRSKSKIPEEIIELSNKREELRQEKRWSEADKIRKQIEEAGFTIEDFPDGVKISQK